MEPRGNLNTNTNPKLHEYQAATNTIQLLLGDFHAL